MAAEEERRGRKRHRWGPPAAVPEPVKPKEDTPEKPTRKRKSRWGDADAPPPKPTPKSAEELALMVFPEKVVLSNGLTINLPPTLTGRAPGGDPEVLEFHKQVRRPRRHQQQ